MNGNNGLLQKCTGEKKDYPKSACTLRLLTGAKTTLVLNNLGWVTYIRIVVDTNLQKAVPEHVRLTIGGDRVEYPGEVTTCTAYLTTVKLHLNSVVSMSTRKFLGVNISNFYLDTPLDHLEHACIAVKYVPHHFIDEYNLALLITNGYLYLEVVKGVYGLPQAGIMANKLLKIWLAPHGYIECTHIHGFWKNVSRKTTFTLWVDFGTCYTFRADVIHLIKTPKNGKKSQ